MRKNRMVSKIWCALLGSCFLAFALQPAVSVRAEDPSLISRHSRVDFAGQSSGTIELWNEQTADGYMSVVSDEDYRIRIHSPKRDYASGEALQITAELEYLGAEQEYRVDAGEPLLGFRVEGANGFWIQEYTAEYPGQQTTLERGKSYRVELKEQEETWVINEEDIWGEDGRPVLPDGTYTIQVGATMETVQDRDITMYATLQINVGVTGQVFEVGQHRYRVTGEQEGNLQTALISTSQQTCDFIVPHSVEWQGRSYRVTQVGDHGLELVWVDHDDWMEYPFFVGSFSEKDFDSVRLPASVTAIGKYAFTGMEELVRGRYRTWRAHVPL